MCQRKKYTVDSIQSKGEGISNKAAFIVLNAYSMVELRSVPSNKCVDAQYICNNITLYDIISTN